MGTGGRVGGRGGAWACRQELGGRGAPWPVQKRCRKCAMLTRGCRRCVAAGMAAGGPIGSCWWAHRELLVAP